MTDANTNPTTVAPETPRARTSHHTRSRPQRLKAVQAEVQNLQDEYQRWFDALPDVLQETPLAELLETAIEQLSEVSEALAGIDLPRGFGRD
ncbi:MAG: hypothetical protein ACYCOR_20740 [Acidobacteriaceae bacterium]